MQKHPYEARCELADVLDALADGGEVTLGEFSDNASPTTDADMQAEWLRTLAMKLRRSNTGRLLG